jgi:hypothetical protein
VSYGIRSISGSTAGATGFVDGYGPNARFYNPKAVVVEPNDPHLLYIADYYNNAIRRLDLDTGYVDTLVSGLASHPFHIAIDANYIWVTTRGGSDDNNPFHMAGPYMVYSLGRDGSIIASVSDGNCWGAIAKDPASANWIVKGSLMAYTTGWGVLSGSGGSWSITHENGLHDGAYGADAGMISVGTRVWRQHEYMYPSGNRFSDGWTIASPYLTTAVPREFVLSPWSPDGYYDLIGCGDTGAQLFVHRVTDSTYVENFSLNLGFSVTNFRGIATIPGSQTFLFSGLNQIWMANFVGGWMTRAQWLD